jgi:hypothetical protein
VVAVLTQPDSERAEWLAWFREAEVELEHASDHVMGLWIAEHKVSEAYLEAVEAFKRAWWRWRTRLTALNAYMDHRHRRTHP